MLFRLERQTNLLAAASQSDIYLKNMLVLPHVKTKKQKKKHMPRPSFAYLSNPDSHHYLLYSLPDLDSLIRLARFPSLPGTDLGLWFLSLGGVLVACGFTVRAVVFTVVVGRPGVCHYQELLDVPLKGR